MNTEGEDLERSLVISKATVLVIIYFVIYSISNFFVDFFYGGVNFLLLMLVDLLILAFTYKVFLRPVFFKNIQSYIPYYWLFMEAVVRHFTMLTT
ncbi:hypothetical protein A7985_11545 [Pseudoalteromonas luteoviolacea]|uniref:Uncharacterized protein n=1 Tax=Pseudoalteromonas luteoviolacea TaxID=43657 RepID=A0A1C0TQN3_9GAMM|nr:hypothetical protein A7985_11545 [Pseudoalteromonas luteoviolacea]